MTKTKVPPNPHSPTETVSPATCLPTPDRTVNTEAAPWCGITLHHLILGSPLRPDIPIPHHLASLTTGLSTVDVSVSADSSAPCNLGSASLYHKGGNPAHFSTQRKQLPSMHLPTGPLTRDATAAPQQPCSLTPAFGDHKTREQSYWFKDRAVDLYLLKSFCRILEVSAPSNAHSLMPSLHRSWRNWKIWCHLGNWQNINNYLMKFIIVQTKKFKIIVSKSVTVSVHKQIIKYHQEKVYMNKWQSLIKINK